MLSSFVPLSRLSFSDLGLFEKYVANHMNRQRNEVSCVR